MGLGRYVAWTPFHGSQLNHISPFIGLSYEMCLEVDLQGYYLHAMSTNERQS